MSPSPQSAQVPPVPGTSDPGMGGDFLGGSPDQASGQPGVDPAEATRAIMKRFHDVESQILALAGGFPAASAEFRMSVQSLRKAMAKVAQSTSQEPQGPPQP